MLFSLNFSTHSGDLELINNNWENVDKIVRDEGFDGLELYPVGDYQWSQIPAKLINGLHLRFYPILLPFWRSDRERLREIFGNDDTIIAFYGGLTRDALITNYRNQLQIAHSLSCKYVVFHLAQSEFEYIYQWDFPWHWQETVDLCAKILNEIFADTNYRGELLVENLWWPGSFQAISPDEISYALGQLAYKNSGIIIDTGHLMNTNQQIADEEEGIAFIIATMKQLGTVRQVIRGLHLTCSLSAEYVNASRVMPTPKMPGTFWDRYGQAIEHVQQIDQHNPFTDQEISGLFDHINPEYITYEFSYESVQQWQEKIRRQRSAMVSIHR